MTTPGNSFFITDDAVNVLAVGMQGSVGDLQATLTQFMNSVAELPGAWRGEDFRPFDTMRQQWDDAGRVCQNTLNELGIRVATAGKTYDSNLQDQASFLSQCAANANLGAASVRLP